MRVAVASCLLAAACQSAPEPSPPPAPPPATRPASWQRILMPQDLLADLDHGLARAGTLAVGELNGAGGIRSGLHGTFDGEVARLSVSTARAGAMAAGETHRLAPLQARLGSLAPATALGRLQHAVDRLPQVLGCDRRPLPEASDRRHHTDGQDGPPEVGWLERLRRRLLP